MTQRWVIWLAVTQHLLWSVCLLASPAPVGVTAIFAVVSQAGGRYPAALVFALVAGMAVLGVAQRFKWWWAALLVIPQQLVLLVSAYGAGECVVRGQFADGVARPFWFMLADQAPSVLVAVFHTCAILEQFTKARKGAKA